MGSVLQQREVGGDAVVQDFGDGLGWVDGVVGEASFVGGVAQELGWVGVGVDLVEEAAEFGPDVVVEDVGGVFGDAGAYPVLGV